MADYTALDNNLLTSEQKENDVNPYSGDIERFPSEVLKTIPERENPFGQYQPSTIPEGWLSLTEQEAEEYERIPKALRIEKYIKSHYKDRCAFCNGFVGNHSPRKFLKCAASHLARIDVARLEDQMNPALQEK